MRLPQLPKEFKEFDFMVKRKRSEMGETEKSIRQLFTPLIKLIEAILSIYMTLVIVPIMFILWLINESIRRIIIVPLLKFKFGDKIKLVPAGEDNIWSFKKPGNSRNILMLSVFGNQIDLKAYQNNFSRRVLDYVDKNGKKPYRKLMKIFTQEFGYCCWKNDDHFDIRNHIKLLNVPKIVMERNKGDFVTESDLIEMLSEFTKDMSSDHPQWEEIVIPRFVYDCHVIVNEELSEDGSKTITSKQLKNSAKIKSAKIFRFNHSYLEGLSALVMIKTCMVDGPFQCSMDPTAPLKISFWEKLVQASTIIFFGAIRMVGNIIAEMNADSRFLTQKFSNKIIHAWSEPIEKEIVEKIQAKMNCSAAEILTCALGGALRAVSQEFCKKPQWLLFDDSLEESVFVGLVKFVIPYPNNGPMNRFGVIGVDVDTTSTSLRLERLKLTQKGFQKYVRGSPVLFLSNWLMQFVGRFPHIIVQKLLKNAGPPVVFSNIPSINNKITLMGQLQLEECAGWMPMLLNSGIGVATAKYGTSMRFCGVSEIACLSHEELDYLLKAMRNEVLIMSQECS